MNDHPPKWPTGVGDDPWFPGGITTTPEITKRLGEFLAQFGNLEWSLIWMLAITLCGPRQEQMAAATLGPVTSVATRCDIVEGATAQSAAIDENTRTIIIGLIGTIRNANTIRNGYVHG